MKGPFKTGDALNMLFDRISETLSPEELKYFASASAHAEQQADNMADILNTMAALVVHENGGEENGMDKTVSNLLWQTSYIFEEISGLIRLSDDAKAMLNNPGIFKAEKSRPGNGEVAK